MKQFFKYVLATIVGLLVFGIIVAIFGAMSIVGMVASGEATKNVSKNSVMVINMNSIVDEQSQPDIVSKLTGGGIETIGLDELLSAIKKAKTNDNIKGIYMEGGLIEMGLASAQEVRAALEDFRESGKWIVSYADVYSQGSYYLASVADKVIVNPKGMVDIHGIGSQPMFVKDLMKKFGVKMQVIKVGQYKSATEMFTEDKMSIANRQQVEAYIKGVWDNIVESISKSRDITPEALNLLADSVTAMMPTEALLSAKLVDTLAYADGVKGVIKQLLEIDEKKAINQVSLEEMRNVKGPRKDGEEIAVYYAFGDIVQEPATGINTGGHQIAAANVCKDIEKLTAPFIGEIPLEGDSKKGFFSRFIKSKASKERRIVVEEKNSNVINEAFRVVRTNLEFIVGKAGKNRVIMFTSANPGSGKTFVSSNLAMSFAIKGRKVLLIDLDFRHLFHQTDVNLFITKIRKVSVRRNKCRRHSQIRHNFLQILVGLGLKTRQFHIHSIVFTEVLPGFVCHLIQYIGHRFAFFRQENRHLVGSQSVGQGNSLIEVVFGIVQTAVKRMPHHRYGIASVE